MKVRQEWGAGICCRLLHVRKRLNKNHLIYTLQFTTDNIKTAAIGCNHVKIQSPTAIKRNMSRTPTVLVSRRVCL